MKNVSHEIEGDLENASCSQLGLVGLPFSELSIYCYFCFNSPMDLKVGDLLHGITTTTDHVCGTLRFMVNEK